MATMKVDIVSAEGEWGIREVLLRARERTHKGEPQMRRAGQQDSWHWPFKRRRDSKAMKVRAGAERHGWQQAGRL